MHGLLSKFTQSAKKIFRHLLHQAIWNSFVLYIKQGGSMKLIDYRVDLFEGLIKRYKTNEFINKSIGKNLNILRLMVRHFPSYVEATIKNKHTSYRCAVCANTFDENGRRKRDTNAKVVILACVQLPALKFTIL